VVANPGLVNELGLPPDSAVIEAGTGPDFTRFSFRDFIREYGPPLALVLVLATLAYRVIRRYGPRWGDRLRDERARRAESEAVYFRRFRQSAKSDDPRAVANAFMAWLDRRHRGQGVATVEAFVERAADPALSRAVSELNEQLYGAASHAHGAPWSASEFVRAVSQARGHQRTRHETSRAVRELTPLNPRTGGSRA